jgi:hypothetical protein
MEVKAVDTHVCAHSIGCTATPANVVLYES